MLIIAKEVPPKVATSAASAAYSLPSLKMLTHNEFNWDTKQSLQDCTAT